MALVTAAQLLIPCSDLGTESPLCLTRLCLFDKTLPCATLDHPYGLAGLEVPIYSLLSAPKPLLGAAAWQWAGMRAEVPEKEKAWLGLRAGINPAEAGLEERLDRVKE